MSLKVAKRPFKSNGIFFPAGTIIDDPAGIKLFKTKVREGKIMRVDEHNLRESLNYLKHRRGVDDETLEDIKARVSNNGYDKEYMEKVKRVADMLDVDIEGLDDNEAVEKVKQAQEEAKRAKESNDENSGTEEKSDTNDENSGAEENSDTNGEDTEQEQSGE